MYAIVVLRQVKRTSTVCEGGDDDTLDAMVAMG